jgi:hypothetical protein
VVLGIEPRTLHLLGRCSTIFIFKEHCLACWEKFTEPPGRLFPAPSLIWEILKTFYIEIVLELLIYILIYFGSTGD